MRENQPNPEHPHLSDEELVEAEIARAVLEKRPITHSGARVIASMIHEGQLTALYALASSGAILEGLPDELERDYNRADRNDQFQIRTWVVQLMSYVESRESTDPIENWSDLWLQQPEYEDTGLDDEDCCTECGEHFANPHQPTCSRSHEDYPEEDDSYDSALTEAREFNSKPDDQLTLEEKIRRKFVGVSTGRLIQRIEKAQDFGYDDEQRELSRRLAAKGQTWKWSESFTYPQVIVYDLPEGER